MEGKKLLAPALILLEACRLSMSFSLDSLKGFLSSQLPFHCLPPAHQVGQLQARSGVKNYLKGVTYALQLPLTSRRKG